MKPIDPQLQKDNDALQKVVLAGMRMLYDPKTFPMFKQGITTKQPLGNILALQTAGLIKMLDKKANHQIPKQVIAPAAVMLLAEIAKFMNEAGLVKPTEQDVKDGIQKMLKIIMAIYSPVAAPTQQEGQPAQAAPAQPAAPVAPPPAPAGLINQPAAGV